MDPFTEFERQRDIDCENYGFESEEPEPYSWTDREPGDEERENE